MKRILAFSLAALMVTTSLVGCTTKTPDDPGISTESGDVTKDSGSAEKFVIGGLGPLTGAAASYGNSVKQGAEIAIEEINKAGGVTVGDKTYELVLNFLDDEAKEDTAVTAYNSLMDKNINVLLGCVTSGASLAISDLTSQDNILQLTPSASASGVIDYPNQFRLCFTDPLQGTTLADYVADDLKLTKAAIIYNNADEYSTGIMNAFVERAAEKNIEIVANEAFNTSDVDFSTQLTKIKATDAEIIVAPIYYEAAAYILSQAADSGITLPFVGSDGWDGVLAQVTDPSIAEGAVFLSPFLVSDPNVQDFVKAYEGAYKATPDQFAADGYDSVYAFKAAMEEAGSIESEDLIGAMTKIQLDGLTGALTFGEDGEPNKGAKFVIVKDGEYAAYK